MLKDEIDEAKRAVTTDTVQITVGEIANMYKQGELNIIPDFQRLFRWTLDRKSNFVESILIGIPVPPAFAYENEDGTWELIDGLQRISTLLEFMGILKDPDNGQVRRSKLLGAKYLPSLEGVVWERSEKPITQENFELPDEDNSLLSDVEEGLAVELPLPVDAPIDTIAVPEEHSLDKSLQLFFFGDTESTSKYSNIQVTRKQSLTCFSG